MATLKITGLTINQSNALAQAFEHGDEQVINAINNYLENMGASRIEEVCEVEYDSYNQGDNQVIL